MTDCDLNAPLGMSVKELMKELGIGRRMLLLSRDIFQPKELEELTLSTEESFQNG